MVIAKRTNFPFREPVWEADQYFVCLSEPGIGDRSVVCTESEQKGCEHLHGD